MRTRDDSPPAAEDVPPKNEMRAVIPLEIKQDLQIQPNAPGAADISARQPSPQASAGLAEEPAKRRRQRSSGPRGSRSSGSRSSSTKSSSSQPGQNVTVDDGTTAPSDVSGRRRRRKHSKERDIARESTSSRESRKGDSSVLDDARVASTVSDKAAHERASTRRATDAGLTGAPSDSGWKTDAKVPPERGEMKIKTPVASALYLPGDVIQRGTQLVAMAATAADVAGVVANIEAAAPQQAATSSPSKAAMSTAPIQAAAKYWRRRSSETGAMRRGRGF